MSETPSATAPALDTPETAPETAPATTEAPAGSEAGSEAPNAAPTSGEAPEAPPAPPAPAPAGKKAYRVKHVKLDFRGQRLRKGDVVFLTEAEFKSFPSHFEE